MTILFLIYLPDEKNLNISTAVFASTVHGWTSLWGPNDRVARGYNWTIQAVTSYVHLWPFSTMLKCICEYFEKHVTKCSCECMAGVFVSDLWRCQLEITQIHGVSFLLLFFVVEKIIKKIPCHHVWEASLSPINCSSKCGGYCPLIDTLTAWHLVKRQTGNFVSPSFVIIRLLFIWWIS